MIDLGAPSIYERDINETDTQQIRLVINTFRGVEYLSLRKYYLDFDEEWLPSKDGISIPLDLSNTQELFTGLVEILSLAESKSIIEDEFKEIIDEILKIGGKFIPNHIVNFLQLPTFQFLPKDLRSIQFLLRFLQV